MKIVHTMIRVNDLDESLKFYCDGLGMKLLKKREYESGRFTNVFVGYGSEETDAVIELTYNWDTHSYDIGNGFGHIALGVADVYKTCDELRAKGIKITREPGPMKHGSGATLSLFSKIPTATKSSSRRVRRSDLVSGAHNYPRTHHLCVCASPSFFAISSAVFLSRSIIERNSRARCTERRRRSFRFARRILWT